MNRRSFLAITGTSGLGAISYPTFTRNMKTSNAFPPIELSLDDDPPDADVSLHAEVLKDFSHDHPGRIKIVLKNEAKQTNQYSFGATPPFSRYHPKSSDGIVLIPESRDHLLTPEDDPESTFIPDSANNGCWRLGSTFSVSQYLQFVELGGDESVSHEYAVFMTAKNRDCNTVDKYRFSIENYLGLDTPWGFDLLLTKD